MKTKKIMNIKANTRKKKNKLLKRSGRYISQQRSYSKKKKKILQQKIKDEAEFKTVRNSLAVQWLGLCAFTTKGMGSIPC